jgi:KUP system potassium uptake protein
VSCLFVVFYFQESSKMEAAYGLSITITMMMTTLLMANYLYQKRTPRWIIGMFLTVYLTIEFAFLITNGMKFMHGGWFSVMIAGILFVIMYSWYQARKIRNRYLRFHEVKDFLPIIQDMSLDETIPKFATNLVFITRADKPFEIEHKNLYSLINKQPKRADVYWLLHIDTLDDPYTMEYKVHHLIPGTLIRIDFNLGFKVAPRINKYFMQIIQELNEKNEIDFMSRYDSLRKHAIAGDFKFVVITRLPNYDTEFPFMDSLIMDIYEIIKHIGISEVKALGLDTNNVVNETVPLVVSHKSDVKLKRVN